MRIVLVGAGSTGRQLASKLCGEKHDVVVIDNDSQALEETEALLDILTVQGPGSCPRTLREAEIEKADLLVAVTNSDEVNILAGQFAHQAGVGHSVVRVSDTDYIQGASSFDLGKLGIERVVSEEAETARELYNTIRKPGTLEVVDLFQGKVQVVSMKVHTDSPLLYQPLKDFPDKDLIQTLRFIAVMRGDELMIPSGKTRFLIGDNIFFVGQPKDLNRFIKWADPDHRVFQKVVIAGGGEVGLSLAKLLETSPTSVVLVEQDPDRALECSKQLNKTLVMQGDALSHEVLDETGLSQAAAYVAATRNDEKNIMSCLLAEQFGASFTLARVSRPEYAPIINNSSLLDRAVSPHAAMVNAILRYIRGRNVRSATLLQNLPGELLEVKLPSDSKWVGRAVRDIKMPSDDIVAAVLRSGTIHIATGSLCFEENDQLVLFSKPGAFKKLESIFRR